MGEHYSSAKKLSTVFPLSGVEIPLGEFDMLGVMPKPKAKPKKKGKKVKPDPTAFQKYLAGLVDESELQKPEIERRSQERGWRVPVSTITDVLTSVTNPGIKTIEGIALALDRDPLVVLAHALDNPPKEGFKDSPLGVLWNLYVDLPSADKEHFDRYVFKPAIEQMRERLK